MLPSLTMPSTKIDQSPAAFALSVLGVRLTEQQKDILKALTRERRVAIKACHASGKSFCAAVAALWFAVRYQNSRVLIVSPTWLNVRAVIWYEIHRLLSSARLRLPLTVENQTEVRLQDSLILGISTNDAAKLSGHHAENLLVIIDEAPGVDPDFFPAIEGILSGGNTKLLMLGNPVTTSGPFYDAFTRNRANWRLFSISAFDCPNLEGVSLEKLLAMPDAELDSNEPYPFLIRKRWVREKHSEWFSGSIENSPLWASRVLGEFPSSGSNALIPIGWLEAAQRPAIDTGSDLIIGCDPAGPGRDRTAIVAASGSAVIDSATFTDSDSRGPVLAWLKRYSSRVRLVRVDSAGLGFYFAEHVRDGGYRTVGVNVASKPNDPERFTNLKAERYWRLRERFQAGEVSGLTDGMLAELAAITWLIDPHGRIAIEGKVDVKAAIGHSPDLAEALMIALGEGAPQPFEYRAAPAASGMGYGHTSGGVSKYHKHAYDNRSAGCITCKEDSPSTGRIMSHFGKGAW